MTFAAAYEDAPRVWGVGRLVIGGEVTPWALSQADVDDEAESQTPRFAALGLGAGDLVLIVSLLSEAIHVVPLEKAAGRCGALYSSADATPADAFRVVALVRQLGPKAVVGVNAAVLDGIAAAGHDVADVLAPVPTVATTDEATRAALLATGLSSRRWVKLGPTSAWEEAPGRLAYDARRWDADEHRGEVVVTNRVERLTPCNRLRTGVRGGVVAPGVIELPG